MGEMFPPNLTPEDANMETQHIINENIGSGRVIQVRDDEFKVIISLDHNFGFYDSNDVKEAVETNRGTIHLSKTGAQLVPAMPQSMIDEKFGKKESAE